MKYNFRVNFDHDIGIQAGYSQEYNKFEFLQGHRENYFFNYLHELDAGGISIQTAKGNTTEWAIQSLFGRINYNYKEKYLLEGNVRYDGTSRLHADTRWGWFPSVSAGWRITEEPFMKGLCGNGLSSMKFRISYGLLGNQNIGFNYPILGNYPYPHQDILEFVGHYPFNNNSLSQGVAQKTFANKSLLWESTSVTDVGIDLLLFDKLSISYDWYRKKTYDILRTAQVTAPLGLDAPYINSGKMLNTGHELTLQYNDRINKGVFEGLVYNARFYIDFFKNKLDGFGAREISGYNLRENGIPYNSFYILEMIGIFQTQSDIDNSPKQFNDNVRPGDFKYRDVDGNGVVDNNDRIVMPGRFPKFEYSFNSNILWKNFDFSFLFQGVQGRKIYAEGWGLDPFRQGTAPTVEYAQNRWRGEGSSNNYPMLYFDFNGNTQNRRSNSWYLHDASFLRLKNLTLGYEFPKQSISKLGISLLRIYFSGDNLLTFTTFKGLDPERIGDGNFAQYPQNKIVSLGVNVEF